MAYYLTSGASISATPSPSPLMTRYEAANLTELVGGSLIREEVEMVRNNGVMKLGRYKIQVHVY